MVVDFDEPANINYWAWRMTYTDDAVIVGGHGLATDPHDGQTHAVNRHPVPSRTVSIDRD